MAQIVWFFLKLWVTEGSGLCFSEGLIKAPRSESYETLGPHWEVWGPFKGALGFGLERSPLEGAPISTLK